MSFISFPSLIHSKDACLHYIPSAKLALACGRSSINKISFREDPIPISKLSCSSNSLLTNQRTFSGSNFVLANWNENDATCKLNLRHQKEITSLVSRLGHKNCLRMAIRLANTPLVLVLATKTVCACQSGLPILTVTSARCLFERHPLAFLSCNHTRENMFCFYSIRVPTGQRNTFL